MSCGFFPTSLEATSVDMLISPAFEHTFEAAMALTLELHVKQLEPLHVSVLVPSDP